MEIKTKYNIGDEVWVMKDNRPQKFIVNGLELECHHWYIMKDTFSPPKKNY